MDAFLSAQLLIILKARQLGLTWLTAAYCLWLCITKPMQLIVVISAKEDWAVEFLERVRFMRRRLPDWMVPPIEKDGAQWMQIVHDTDANGKPLIVSEIKSLATTVEGAQSKTPNVLVMDETARNRYARDIFSSSKPGIDKAGGRIIVISNSHKDGVGWGWTRGIYQGAIAGKNQFERIFMPWWDCPERLTDTEQAMLERHPTGFDADGTAVCRHFRTAQLASGYDEDKFSENYPETEQEAVSAMLGSYFGKALQRHQHARPGVRGYLQETRNGDIEFVPSKHGIVEVWRFPYHLLESYDGLQWCRRYCIGSDVSEGLGLSNSVAYVKDRLQDEFVAKACSNRVDAYEWAEQLRLLSGYYKSSTVEFGGTEGALIAVETTGAGQTTVKRLKDANANLYVQLIPDKTGSEMVSRYGWHESNQAKHTLSEDLKHWLKTMQGTLYDQQLLYECSTWIRHEFGKIGPEDETKLGDHVIAAGLTIEADIFIGSAPERYKPPVEGWRKKLQRESESPWAV